MRHRPVDHAFGQIQALLPALEEHLYDVRQLLVDAQSSNTDIAFLVQTNWHTSYGLLTTITVTGAELPAGASSHQKLAFAGARAALEGWEHIAAARVERLLSAVVANDASKPPLCLTFLAQYGSRPTTFHLRLEATDGTVTSPRDGDRIGTPNAPTVLRALRLATMAKGVGTGKHWLLSLDGNTSGFLRVQAPTARVALAWLVGTRVADLPERAAFGTSIGLTEIHPEATSMLQRWARITPPLAPAPVSETHLGF